MVLSFIRSLKIKIAFFKSWLRREPLNALFCLAFAIGLSGVMVGCASVHSRVKVPQVDEIQLAVWGSAEELKTLNQRLAVFHQEYPHIRVKLVHAPDNYFQKLHILAAAGLMPDVMMMNSLYFPVYATHGLFQNLMPFLKQSQPKPSKHPLSLKAFYPQALQAFSFSSNAAQSKAPLNALYVLPRDVSNLVVFINQDHFKAAHQPLPTGDWTGNDFLKNAQQLTKDANGDGEPDVYGVSFYRKPPLFWLPFLWSAGGQWQRVSPSGESRGALHEKQSLAGLRFYQALATQHQVIPPKSRVGDANMSQLFLQGKLAMLVSGRWMVPVLRQQATFDWDVRPFPRFLDSAGHYHSRVGIDATGYAMSASTRYPKSAWALMAFLSSEQSQAAFSESGLLIPARRAVAESTVFLSPKKPPHSGRYFLTAMEAGVPTQSHPRWNEIAEVLTQGLEPAWDGTISVEEAVAAMTPKLNELLQSGETILEPTQPNLIQKKLIHKNKPKAVTQ